MVAVDNATSSTAAPEEAPIELTREQKIEQAASLYVVGKKAFMKSAFDDASDALADVLSLRTEVFGAKAEELYEPLMLYGKTLLELSRMEGPVIAGALTGLEDTPCDDSTTEEAGANENGDAAKVDSKIDGGEMTEAEREDVIDKVDDALAENADAIDNKQPLPDADKEEKKDDQKSNDEKADDKKDEAAEASKEEKAVDEASTEEKTTDDNSAGEDEAANGDSADDSETMDAEDVDDLSNTQLAYENVEMARVIAKEFLADVLDEKKPEWREKLADALLLLGEVYIGDEQFERAVVELRACLDEQQIAFAAHDRRIAETYFQMGRAYTQLSQFDKAAEVYKQALEVITELKKVKTADAEKTDNDEDKKCLTEEADKLGKLIEDIESWVKDSVESHTSASEVRAEIAATGKDKSPAKIATTTDASAPASDISGLVRKRKVDDAAATNASPGKENAAVAPAETETAAKKAKVDDDEKTAENGAAVAE